MRRLAPLLIFILLILALGCSGADNRESTVQEYIYDPQTDTVQEAAVQDGKTEEEQEELVLSFVGDMMFDRSVAGIIKSKGDEYIFQGYEKYFRSSDIVLGNLETSLSSRGKPDPEKEYTFRSNPKIASQLKKYKFSLLSIANNHVLDYGTEAFTDTLDILKKNGISYGGGGYNKKEALEGVIVEEKGLKIGFIAFTGVTPKVEWYAGSKKPGIIGAYKVHEEEVLTSVKALKSKCDILVVSLHWGKEGSTIVKPAETELAHKLVDSGADVIMGHHPHVVKSLEMYKGKPVFYSLGNFFFTTSRAAICNKTMLATVRFHSSGELNSVEVIPGIIKEGRPVPVGEPEQMNINTTLK